ncbi:MAG: alanine racemase [Acidobacteria bacterium]|nr:MAG: alanine racemase [Acidobacteriota bacterium]PYS16536.1 MAG: alanine racemase [Acidobacteriota bacterium]
MVSWIEIDRARLVGNLNALRALNHPGTALLVVVKANAYGHGLATVAPVIAEYADWLGVNCLDEALAITRLGIQKPVAILGHTPLDDIEAVVRNGYRQVLYRLDVARALSEAAQKHGTIAQVHLKIETGTNRQGIAPAELQAFTEEIGRLPRLHVEGVYTHFANVEDTLDPSFAQSQLRRFQEALATLERAGIRPQHVHASATAGSLLYPEMDFTMVRIGIGTYGVWPSRETQLAARERGRKPALQPVLEWKTRVVQVKDVRTGDYVGYGLTYRASRPMKLVVLPIGYYDGYDRKLSNSGRALIHGQPASVVGRVAMNMTMVDVTDIGADLDDEVVLIGRQGNGEIRAEELAEKIGTIPYEVLARINPLIPRVLR